MNFKTVFAPEISLRLTEDLDGFVCTVRRPLFRKDCTTFSLDPSRDVSPEPLLLRIGKSRSYRIVVLRPQLKDPHL